MCNQPTPQTGHLTQNLQPVSARQSQQGHLREPELEPNPESFSSFLLSLLISSTATLSGRIKLTCFLRISKYSANGRRPEQGTTPALGEEEGLREASVRWPPLLQQGERIQALGGDLRELAVSEEDYPASQGILNQRVN